MALSYYDRLEGSWLQFPTANSVPVPDLDGELSLSFPDRFAASSDWGGTISHLPSAVLHPGSIDDIAKMVRFCRASGIRIAARGQGHTMYGQSQVRDGIVINMARLNKIHSVEADSVRVDAGLTWRDLLLAAIEKGLTPSVLTDYLSVSVGGTLTFGGVSGTSYRYGAQVDNVLNIDVVTGTGELITCSMTQHRDLFEAALAGLGQCAVIVRATIKLIGAPRYFRIFDLTYRELGSLLSDFQRLLVSERFNYLQGIIPKSPSNGFATFWKEFLFTIQILPTMPRYLEI